MEVGAIRSALGRLGEELGCGEVLELAIIGGAAGLLTGLLPGSITTSDVDAIRFRPSTAVDEILQAAARVADALGVPKSWLNIEAGLFTSALPGDWEARRMEIGAFGRLRVYAIGRLDLIAMKFYAHREVDFEHLAWLDIGAADLAFVRAHLTGLLEKLPADRSKIEMAIYVVDNWSTRHGRR